MSVSLRRVTIVSLTLLAATATMATRCAHDECDEDACSGASALKCHSPEDEYSRAILEECAQGITCEMFEGVAVCRDLEAEPCDPEIFVAECGFDTTLTRCEGPGDAGVLTKINCSARGWQCVEKDGVAVCGNP